MLNGFFCQELRALTRTSYERLRLKSPVCTKSKRGEAEAPPLPSTHLFSSRPLLSRNNSYPSGRSTSNRYSSRRSIWGHPDSTDGCWWTRRE
jgi:hypothetical protein